MRDLIQIGGFGSSDACRAGAGADPDMISLS